MQGRGHGSGECMTANEIMGVLNQIRTDSGISITTLAEISGYNAETIRRWLGCRNLSTIHGIIDLAQVLGCEIFIRRVADDERLDLLHGPGA